MTWKDVLAFIEKEIVPAGLLDDKFVARGDPSIVSGDPVPRFYATRAAVYGMEGPELYLKRPGA